MTKADNSETLRVGGWIPPYAPGGSEPASSTPWPGPPGRSPRPGQPAGPSPRRSRRPLAVLAGATAAAVLGYGIAAVVVFGGEPEPRPEFALPPTPSWTLDPASPPVSVLPPAPTGEAVASPDIRKVRGGSIKPATRGTATPSRSATTSPAPDPVFTVGRTVGIGLAGLSGHRVRNRDFVARVEAVGAADALSSRFEVRRGLADAGCISFESAEHPGFYLRHRNYVLLLERADATTLYLNDATFCPVATGGGFALRSANYPGHHLVHADGLVRLVQSAPAQATVFRALPPI